MSSKKTPHLSSKTSTGILEVVLEDAPAKSLQTELQTRQLEKILLTRTTASREGEMSRGHHRMREFQGDAISASKHRGAIK